MARQRLSGRERIITTLTEQGAVSRADVARLAALAPSTVTAVVAELMASGLVVELDEHPAPASGSRGGRPPVLIVLRRSVGVAVGIDFGKRHVRVAVTDLAHNLLGEQQRPVDQDRPADEDIRVASDMVRATLEQVGASTGEVVGVGMGIPGPVRRSSGQLGDSTILPGWVGVHAADAMGSALDCPVHADNDANLGALGEWMWGAARGHSEVVYLKAATGIGAGFILNGRPFGGAGGTAGEIGHTVIDPNGPVCRCGNRGCLEMLAGSDAVLAAMPGVGLERVIASAQRGERVAMGAVADAGTAMGLALATLCNLVNPELIVVGGELASAGDLLLDPMREALQRSAIHSAAADVTIVRGELGERAEVLGAVALALLRSTAETLRRTALG